MRRAATVTIDVERLALDKQPCRVVSFECKHRPHQNHLAKQFVLDCAQC